jgi:hypothetical protein
MNIHVEEHILCRLLVGSKAHYNLLERHDNIGLNVIKSQNGVACCCMGLAEEVLLFTYTFLYLHLGLFRGNKLSVRGVWNEVHVLPEWVSTGRLFSMHKVHGSPALKCFVPWSADVYYLHLSSFPFFLVDVYAFNTDFHRNSLKVWNQTEGLFKILGIQTHVIEPEEPAILPRNLSL